MPRYTFECLDCGHEEPNIVIVRSEDRDKELILCDLCEAPMKRQFPTQAGEGIEVFVPYYDEALGINIYSKSQKLAELRKRGLIEAGDKEGGARMYDESLPNASRMMERPIRPGCDEAPVEADAEREDFDIAVQSADGSVEAATFEELEEAATDGDVGAGEDAFDHMKESPKRFVPK